MTETIVLELPENVLALLRACVPDVKAYLQYSILEAVKADMDNDQVFRELLTEKYKLS